MSKNYKESLKQCHIRQVFAKYRLNQNEMQWEGKLKLRSHNTSYYLIEVVTTAGLTVT